MTIRKRNCDPNSFLYGPVGPWLITVPRTDFQGISSTTPAALGDKLVMNGSYCRNISTDTFSCDLRVPVYPVITSVANADQWAIKIVGRNQFNCPVSEVLVKSRTNAQTEGQGLNCYSHIDSMTVLAASTVTNNVRVGWCCGSYAFATVDLGARVTSGVGINRRFPLPFVPRTTTDGELIFRGPVTGAQLITASPSADAETVTFAATTATYSNTWDVSGVAAYDIAVTHDGYIGRVASAAANAVTVVAWIKNGVAGTPANVTMRSTKTPAVQVFRYAGLKTNFTPTLGGLLPGGKVMPLANSSAGTYSGYTGSIVAGIDITSATFGTTMAMEWEPMTDLVFEFFLKPDAFY